MFNKIQWPYFIIYRIFPNNIQFISRFYWINILYYDVSRQNKYILFIKEMSFLVSIWLAEGEDGFRRQLDVDKSAGKVYPNRKKSIFPQQKRGVSTTKFKNQVWIMRNQKIQFYSLLHETATYIEIKCAKRKIRWWKLLENITWATESVSTSTY